MSIHRYKDGTILYRLIEDDWSGKTVEEIAGDLNSTVESIKSLMQKIKKETGYKVSYLHLPPIPYKNRYTERKPEPVKLKQLRDFRVNARCDTCWNTDCRIMSKRKAVCWIGCRDYIGYEKYV